jgi:hypothetical protein
MKIPSDAAWVIRRLLTGRSLNGETEHLTGDYQTMAKALAEVPLEDRSKALRYMMVTDPDFEETVIALSLVDPDGSLPSAPKRRSAHLGDLAASAAAGRFVWLNWIVKNHVTLLSSDPKVGKTHVCLDLARRQWLAEPWPDGQAPTFPAGTPTLWVCGDRHQDELRDRASAFGLPPEAVRLNALPEDPYSGWDLDNPDNVKLLRELIELDRPGLVFIDTVWRATRRRLNRETEVNELMTPIITIAQECGTAIVGLMHLSKDNETLGRRLEGLARGIMKLFKPAPDQPDRRRLEVIGNFKEPPALGVTLRDSGCDFDGNPPTEPARHSGGRPPEEREKTLRFIFDALTRQNDRLANDLAAECESKLGISSKTFWRAVNEARENGKIVSDGGKGAGKQMCLHLIIEP